MIKQFKSISHHNTPYLSFVLLLSLADEEADYCNREEEETGLQHEETSVLVCKCLNSSDSEKSEEVIISPRKQKALSVVSRTEKYLRERRIPELIRFLLTKVICHAPDRPMEYLEQLLDDCMLFRAGQGLCPALFQMRHLEAVVKSFDPGQSGWLSSSQVRRAFMTTGITPPDATVEKYPTDDVLMMLRDAQENQLLELLSAGLEKDVTSSTSSSSETSSDVCCCK